MKKHWKKIVLVLGIILLSVAGYLVYLFQFKEYEVADEKVDEITKEEYEVKLPDGSTIILDKEGNVIEQPGETPAADGSPAGTDSTVSDGETAASGGESVDETDSAAGTSTNSGSASSTEGTESGGSASSGSADSPAAGTASGGSGSGASGGSGSNGGSAGGSENGSGTSAGGGSTGDSAGTVTVASIKQKYEPTMADVEGQANSRINGLIGRAKEEYSAKKANGESISYPYFYNKYVSAATDLEKRTDQVFYAVLGAMKKELKANGLAESHADKLVSEYEARKEQRKSDLLSQATGM